VPVTESLTPPPEAVVVVVVTVVKDRTDINIF
jgi:hypothetical protein